MVLKRFGVLGIIFKTAADFKEPQFLILHRKLNWSGWELLKGGIEEGESEDTALRREIFEESGLRDIEIIKHLDTSMIYWDRARKIQNELSIFLVKADSNAVVSFLNNTAEEHDGFEWVSAAEAIKRLKFSDTKRLIRFAVEELKLHRS